MNGTWWGVLIGLFIGANVGFIALALFMNKGGTIDDCVECKEAMCRECEQIQAARLDVKALDEKCQTLNRSIAQLRGENCRLYGKLHYQQYVGVAH